MPSRHKSKPTILVLGSIAWEVALTPDKEDPLLFNSWEAWVGAPIIREMINEALQGHPSGDLQANLIPENPGDELKEERITTVFKSFPKKSGGKKPKPTTLRVDKNYPSGSSDQARLKQYIKANLSSSNESDIVVLYDQDSGFHRALKEILGESKKKYGTKHLLVVAFANEIWQEFPETIKKIRVERPDTIVLLTAEGLRKWGLNIVEYGSIEQTVREVVDFSKEQPVKAILEHCDHLIIVLEETGAIYIRRQGDCLEGSIHFCPNFDRVAQMDVEVYGRAPSRTAIALAAVVSELALNWEGGAPLKLDKSIRLAVAAYNLQFGKGFEKEVNPFDTTRKALSGEQRKNLKELLENRDPEKPGQEFFVSSLDFHVDDKILKWNRLTNVLPAGREEEVKKILYRVVRKGVEHAFRTDAEEAKNNPDQVASVEAKGPWFPEATITCPYLEVGSIKTFDPEEIAGFMALAKVIRKYLKDDKWTTPLSIAVFGEPGSGKSFGVKELLKHIKPDIDAPLTFNLAQFDSVATLTEAFHHVQDRALSSDVPLVIFDEFDCEFANTPLGWLKYFLAPMNDGVFRGQSAEYRVGRAIFLFAGGTASSFNGFRDQSTSDQGQNNSKSAKLPDFISRLHGFLDVVDINPPRQPSSDSEPAYRGIQRKLRRAVILRSLLLLHAKRNLTHSDDGHDIANINNRVIDAFLNVPRYQHGLRSMDSIVRLCRWIDGRLVESSLPSAEQLEMHAPGFWKSLGAAP